jgi:nitrogen fixation/metabolism regulation signal transduction histidine kinase
MTKFKRLQKLPKPSLQLTLTMIFVGVSALAMLLQFLLFMAVLLDAAVKLPRDSSVMLHETNGLLLKVFLISFLLFLPLALLVGVLTTFRIAGPIRRFELFLESILRGDQPRECKLRKGDQLQEFCGLLNRVTEPLRAPRATNAEEGGPLDRTPGSSVMTREAPEPASTGWV